MEKQIKLGVVGLSRGSAHMKFFNRGDRSAITAVCDVDPDHLAGVQADLGLPDERAFTKFDDMLNTDIDAVVISTPIPFHEEQAVKALEAGKHVFSEVTMANTVDGCLHIYEAAKRSDRIYMMAENYIYFGFIQQWKKYVEEGKLGRIHYAEAEYIHDIRNRLYYDGTREGETYWRTYRPPIHYCTHCLGPVMYLIGDGDYIVKATGSGSKNTMVTDLWPSTIDMQVALFETKKGRGIKICRSQVTPRPEPHTVYYSIYGTKGFIENTRHAHDGTGLRYFEGIDKQTVPVDCFQNDTEAPDFAKNSHGTSDYLIAETFLDCIEAGRKPYLNEDTAAELTLPGIVAHEACVKGNVWLDVPHFGK